MPNTSSQGNLAGGLPFSIGGITSPPNPGGVAPPGGFAPGSVDATALAAGAVTAPALAAGAVTAPALGAGAVGAAALGAGAVSDVAVNAGAAIAATKLSGIVPSAQIIRGEISGAGGITRGTGFTVVRNSAGNYTITLTPALGTVPAVVITVANGAAVMWTVGASPTTSLINVLTFNNASVATDQAFEFIAIAV